MRVTPEQIRGYRLHAHHLDKKIPAEDILTAAGACGLQNTPPGAWETALYNRLADCTPELLEDALYNQKTLLQAWSYRGVPVIFPTAQSGVFLTSLVACEGEQPWVYTRGITGALDYLGMSFDDLLLRTKAAVLFLDSHTVSSKEALDQTLAGIVERDLPEDKRPLWRDPSMYGSPDRQTVGGAAVSFLLRPCAFHSLVVFGERQDNSPTFTSFKNWTGHLPPYTDQPEKALVRKFLHCYGPATLDFFVSWTGASKAQAKRIWDSIADEMTAVEVGGKTRYMLTEDCDILLHSRGDTERLLLLGPHDPYLDLRDREIILEDKAHQKILWQLVSNPGAVLKGGRIIGFWKGKTQRNKLEVTVTLWEPVTAAEHQELEELAQEYATFRGLELKDYCVKGE